MGAALVSYIIGRTGEEHSPVYCHSLLRTVGKKSPDLLSLAVFCLGCGRGVFK